MNFWIVVAACAFGYLFVAGIFMGASVEARKGLDLGALLVGLFWPFAIPLSLGANVFAVVRSLLRGRA